MEKIKELKNELFKKRFLLIDGEINRERSDEIDEGIFALSLKGSDPIKIIFRTNGGSPSWGLRMYDAIKSAPVETIGYGVNRCSSAGLYPFAGCVKRIGMPHSRYLFHSMRTNFSVLHNHPFGVSVEDQIKGQLNQGNLLHERKQKALLSELTISPEKLLELEREGDENDRFLFPEEALGIGLLTEIGGYKPEENFWKHLIKK